MNPLGNANLRVHSYRSSTAEYLRTFPGAHTACTPVACIPTRETMPTGTRYSVGVGHPVRLFGAAPIVPFPHPPTGPVPLSRVASMNWLHITKEHMAPSGEHVPVSRQRAFSRQVSSNDMAQTSPEVVMTTIASPCTIAREAAPVHSHGLSRCRGLLSRVDFSGSPNGSGILLKMENF